MPVDILPSLGRMEIEDHIKAMIFAVAQHLVKACETRLFIFEWRSIVFEVPIINRYPDDVSAGLPEKDHIVFIEEVVEHTLEEELRSRGTKHFRHLSSKSMLRTWVPVDEILHVHPTARTGSPQANLLSFGIDDMRAADA